mgnify:CR=1 FL=1
MKHLILTIATIGLCVSCTDIRIDKTGNVAGDNTALPDSCYTRKAILSIRDSLTAYSRLDEAVALGKMIPADAWLLRREMWVIRHQEDYMEHLDELEQLMDGFRQELDDDSVRLVPRRRLVYMESMYEYYAIKENYKEMFRYISEELEAAKIIDSDKTSYIEFCHLYLQFKLDSSKENIQRLKAPMRKALGQCVKKGRFAHIADCYEKYIIMLDSTDIEEQLWALDQYEQYLLNCKNPEWDPDRSLSFVYSTRAHIYQQTGNTVEARRNVEKWKATKFSKTSVGQMIMFAYWANGDVEDAKEAIRVGKNMFDTITGYNHGSETDFLRYLAQAYAKVGDNLSAYKTIQRCDSFNVKLLERNIDEEGQKWAKIFDLKEKEYELEQQQAQNQLAWTIATFALVLLVVLSISGFVYVRNARQTKRKNKALAKQLAKIEEYRTEISQLRYTALHRRDSRKATDLISDEELSEEDLSAVSGGGIVAGVYALGFIFGMSPLGPRILPRRPTTPIISGVATTASNPNQFSFLILSAISSTLALSNINAFSPSFII